MGRNRLGHMIPGDRNYRPPRPYETWALDNGAYSAGVQGKPWDEKQFYKIIDRLPEQATAPDFIVTPDIYRGGPESLDHSLDHAPRLPAEIPKYLPIQPGMDPREVRRHILKFDGLFIGGGKAWRQQGAPEFIRLAQDRGRLVHIGQVGTLADYTWAYHAGADSCDGGGPARNQDIDRPIRWRRALEGQATLGKFTPQKENLTL